MNSANMTSASAINARRRVTLTDRSRSRRAAVLLPDHRFANSLGATLSRRHPRNTTGAIDASVAAAIRE